MNRQDAFALAYGDACLTELRRDPATVLQVSARNQALFASNGLGHQRYVERRRDLLALGIDSLSTVVLAGTDEGQALRSTAPFAGVLSQDAVRSIRAASKEVAR
jgi:hypothetical protein